MLQLYYWGLKKCFLWNWIPHIECNLTYPSRIYDKSFTSFSCMLVQYSISWCIWQEICACITWSLLSYSFALMTIIVFLVFISSKDEWQYVHYRKKFSHSFCRFTEMINFDVVSCYLSKQKMRHFFKKNSKKLGLSCAKLS